MRPLFFSLLAFAASAQDRAIQQQLAIENSRVLLEKQLPDIALPILRQITKEDEYAVDAWLMLGHCYAKLGQREEQLKAYQRAVEADPRSAEAKLQLGLGLILARKKEEVQAQITELEKIDPERALRLSLLYWSLLHRGQ